MRLPKLILLAATMLVPMAAGAQVPRTSTPMQSPSVVRDYIRIINSSEPGISSLMGVLAMRAGGDTLASFNHLLKLVPASNTKLISTGLALNELGSDYTFETKIGFTGEIVEGTLKGDVYIIGGGDPTLASKDSIASPIDGVFSIWYNALNRAGIRRIEGRVIGDGRFFEGPLDPGDWSWGDMGTYYGTGGNGLCFYRNVQDINVKAGEKVGDPIEWELAYPDTPWMKYHFISSTGEEGTGDELYLYTSELAPVAEMRGTFAVDRKPKKEECSNKYGAYTCGYYFTKYLEKRGVTVTGGVADIDSEGMIRTDLSTWKTEGKAAPEEDIKVLTSTKSPSLKRICRITNYRSDNFYAETLYRILGKEKKGSAVYDSSYVARHDALRNIGLDPEKGAVIVDGSGLSRGNYISADFFCRYLKAMMKTPVYKDFLETLQSPGQGSYSARLNGESAMLKNRIHMKSGSMGGVVCFSGYILPSDGNPDDTIIFSILTNNNPGPSWRTYGQIDRIIALLAGMN